MGKTGFLVQGWGGEQNRKSSFEEHPIPRLVHRCSLVRAARYSGPGRSRTKDRANRCARKTGPSDQTSDGFLREDRISWYQLFVSFVYFSRGTPPTKKGVRKGTYLGDLASDGLAKERAKKGKRPRHHMETAKARTVMMAAKIAS